MGVLITGEEVSVLIDGLHEYYGPAYLNPPQEELIKMISGQGVYDRLNFALFTHFHRDHYSANLARRFLRAFPSRRVAGAPQVIDSLAAGQVLSAWNRNGLLFNDSASGFAIYSFDVPHTWPERHSKVQNVAYLVKSGKSNLLHIGDADTDVSTFRKLHLGKIDVLVIPAWFLMNKQGKEIIEKIIKPHTVIATHISPGEQESVRKYKLTGIRTHFFTTINQALIIK